MLKTDELKRQCKAMGKKNEEKRRQKEKRRKINYTSDQRNRKEVRLKRVTREERESEGCKEEERRELNEERKTGRLVRI